MVDVLERSSWAEESVFCCPEERREGCCSGVVVCHIQSANVTSLSRDLTVRRRLISNVHPPSYVNMSRRKERDKEADKWGTGRERPARSHAIHSGAFTRRPDTPTSPAQQNVHLLQGHSTSDRIFRCEVSASR